MCFWSDLYWIRNHRLASNPRELKDRSENKLKCKLHTNISTKQNTYHQILSAPQLIAMFDTLSLVVLVFGIRAY